MNFGEIMIGDVNVAAIFESIVNFVLDVLRKVIPNFDDIIA